MRDSESPDPPPKVRRSRWRFGLRAILASTGLLVSLVAFMAFLYIGLQAALDAIISQGEPGRECGTVSRFSDDELDPLPKGFVIVSYIDGDEFIGVGDEYWTKPIRASVTDPPLKSGDVVSFKLSRGDVPAKIRRATCDS